ncbi:MAG: hypothetical protein FWG17_05320 [Desulfovibrionaceae bacterium]|nr:hypothetical protein [Desulfovibrionaceae bacterium]
MEAALINLARQLNSYDEASLLNLWRSYMGKVAHFEPSQRWEEAALALCLIQAVYWKNQLYNAEMAAGTRRGQGKDGVLNELAPELQPFYMQYKQERESRGKAHAPKVSSGKRCSVVLFDPGEK